MIRTGSKNNVQLELSGVWTLVAALATIAVGQRINRAVPWIERGNIPPAVTAGLLLSLVLAGLRAGGWLDVRFATAPRDVLLLVFFASLGFGAHLGQLASAGKGALVICVAITLAVLAQNAAGIVLAEAFGEPRALGLFLGSIAFLGGHGTATAWANSPEAAALPGAFEVGIGAATLGLVLGGLVAGPVAVWLATRSVGEARHATVFGTAASAPGPEREAPFSSDRWLLPLLWLLLCVAAGPWLREWAAARGMQAPTFLAVLLVGVLVTNLADAARRPLDTEVTDLVGTVALRIFLAIAMMSLDWIQLVEKLPLLLAGAALQALITVAIAVLVVYVLFGRDREAAAASGGFIGFSLGAMPVGLAVMRRLNTTFGETPRALLAITLAASLYTDTVNALIIAALFRWLGG
jgi:ESS family glutamate:Na+ symporter